MEAWRWGAATVLLACFLWLAALNWVVFWKRHVKRIESPSWIPLMAGTLGCLGLLVTKQPAARWAWVPFVVDWGCLPGLLFTLVFHATRRRA